MSSATSAGQLEQDMMIVDKAIKHAGRPITIVWAVLMVATFVSWWFGDGHGATKLASVMVIVTGFVKVSLVGDHFMELRSAPPQLRWAFMGWCVVMPSILCGIYLLRY